MAVPDASVLLLICLSLVAGQPRQAAGPAKGGSHCFRGRIAQGTCCQEGWRRRGRGSRPSGWRSWWGEAWRWRARHVLQPRGADKGTGTLIASRHHPLDQDLYSNRRFHYPTSLLPITLFLNPPKAHPSPEAKSLFFWNPSQPYTGPKPNVPITWFEPITALSRRG
jgi:hypothetical protein